MPKKAQAFYNVSEAINLDSKGLRQVAFGRYLQCLQMLSNLLVERFCSAGCQMTLEKDRKEAKQILSVISDCSERAQMILANDGNAVSEQKNNRDTSITGSNQTARYSDKSNFISSNFPAELIPVPSEKREQVSRHSVFEKVEKENKELFRKFQVRIDQAKDKYVRANLQLELQRRLAENVTIARSKHAQLLKEQQEEKKNIFEVTLKNVMKIGPSLNENDQERRDLYLEVLQYEANHSEHLISEYSFPEPSPSKVVEKVFQRTLRLENHPLTQWLFMKQMKVKEKLNRILREYSRFTDWLPENNTEVSGTDAPSLILSREQIWRKPHEGKEIISVQESVDDIAEEIQNNIETMLQIFCNAYKKELPPESEIFSYKLIESSMLAFLWPTFIAACRFANINTERRIAYTFQCCLESSPIEFGIPSDIITKEDEMFKFAVHQLKQLSSLTSVMDKLSTLVQVSRNLCENASKSNTSESRKMGADDLVPILSYVLVHTSMPQLLSECRALELLVDPKYMLGEEGYALTSFQAALNYLEMKKLMELKDVESSMEKSSDDSEQSSSGAEHR